MRETSTDFNIFTQVIIQDDETLVEMFMQASSDQQTTKKIFEKTKTLRNEDDYLSYTVAKLAFNFANEEHNVLLSEIQKRGLILN